MADNNEISRLLERYQGDTREIYGRISIGYHGGIWEISGRYQRYIRKILREISRIAERYQGDIRGDIRSNSMDPTNILFLVLALHSLKIIIHTFYTYAF